jgi:hypothetical protein
MFSERPLAFGILLEEEGFMGGTCSFLIPEAQIIQELIVAMQTDHVAKLDSGKEDSR